LAYYVYLLASRHNGTLYCGVTSDLIKRMYEHKEGLVEGFTKKYGVKAPVWFETREDVNEAITREKQIKEWKREWKVEMIERSNPYWRDLHPELLA
jgi:putative endonuclease